MALSEKGLLQQDLADFMGVGKTVVSMWINKGIMPNNLNKFFPMAKFLDVNPAWLAGFDVPMTEFRLDKREMELIKLFRKLNETNKVLIENTLTALGKVDNAEEENKRAKFG